MNPTQAVYKVLEALLPDVSNAQVYLTVYEGYSLFAVHPHGDASITARVNHMYPYEVIFILDAD
jgi:hypothetical protein